MKNIKLISKNFVKQDGKFDLEEAMLFNGKIAGVCHSENGYDELENEAKEKTLARVNYVLNKIHFSVFEHVTMTLNLTGFSKILFMILNSLQVYSASEKSLRYKSIDTLDGVSLNEAVLYEKWREKIEFLVCKEYKKLFSAQKVKSLAQENARYFLSVFSQTTMVYSTNLRQINFICAIFKKFIHENKNSDDKFFLLIVKELNEFVIQTRSLNLCHKKLMRNDKDRSISFFIDPQKKEIYPEVFSQVYLLKSKSSFACMAQEIRHRTIKYAVCRHLDFYIPKIVQKYNLSCEWIEDMNSVSYVYPQGSLLEVVEIGDLDSFILKLKERLCFHTQLETMEREKDNLKRYFLETPHQYIKQRLEKYMKGARCTFPDYFCDNPCGHIKEGVALFRII